VRESREVDVGDEHAELIPSVAGHKCVGSGSALAIHLSFGG
jgi:hypothetical protein